MNYPPPPDPAPETTEAKRKRLFAACAGPFPPGEQRPWSRVKSASNVNVLRDAAKAVLSPKDQAALQALENEHFALHLKYQTMADAAQYEREIAELYANDDIEPVEKLQKIEAVKKRRDLVPAAVGDIDRRQHLVIAKMKPLAMKVLEEAFKRVTAAYKDLESESPKLEVVYWQLPVGDQIQFLYLPLRSLADDLETSIAKHRSSDGSHFHFHIRYVLATAKAIEAKTPAECTC
jgi:hypothetical protein